MGDCKSVWKLEAYRAVGKSDHERLESLNGSTDTVLIGMPPIATLRDP